MSIKIKKLSFVAGPKPNSDPLEFSSGTLTLLVGPNNSGKSQTLREIENLCTEKINSGKILQSLELEYPKDNEEIKKLLEVFEIQSENPMYRRFSKPSLYKKSAEIYDLQPHEIANLTNLISFKSKVVPFYLVRLDGRTRFSLVEEQASADIQKPSQNHLMTLFKNDNDREEISEIIYKTFGFYFVIDPTGMKQFRIRLSRIKPNTNEERGLTTEAIEFHDQAHLITELGDGIQAFVGLIAALKSFSDSIILIDEPEAFLASPIARRLGFELARIAETRNANLIVATHSPDFVMGCIEATQKINLVRLTYQNEMATTTQLEAEKIKRLFKNPILRSTGVIQGLFHPAVIITEGHSDRIIYEEINRLLNEQQQGIADSLFLMSGDKNRIHKVIKPLREIGVLAVAIVDLDFIDDGNGSGTCWDDLTNACGLCVDVKEKINKLRRQVLEIFSKITNSKPLKNKGINNLEQTDREIVKDFLDTLALYGLFIVPVGEVEDWGDEIGIQKPSSQNSKLKNEWPENFLNKIEESFDLNTEIATFLKKIADWTKDPERKGIN